MGSARTTSGVIVFGRANNEVSDEAVASALPLLEEPFAIGVT